MGKVILCTGKIASRPYTFALSGIRVYSIEEMSYYLYTHIYEIYEDFLQQELISWIREDLEMEELVDKLTLLYKNQNNLKDIVVTILCSNDYYSEEEIKGLIQLIDDIMGLEGVKRRKIRADYLLNYQMYQSAAREYEAILKEGGGTAFTKEEYGNILHNIGITCVYTTSLLEAAERFKEAYNLNHKEESLKQYLTALLLAGRQSLYQEELLHYECDETFQQNLYDWISEKEEQAKKRKEYQELVRLETLGSLGGMREDGYLREQLSTMKARYRLQMEG